MLLRRTPALRLIAEKYRRNEFARLIADGVRFSANNEKSTQIRMVKLLFLNDKSDFTMVSNYQIGASLNAYRQDIDQRVWKHRGMYIYPKLFDLFCAGLESGRLRGVPALPWAFHPLKT